MTSGSTQNPMLGNAICFE